MFPVSTTLPMPDRAVHPPGTPLQQVLQVAFMGWFGPRGLASIVFAVIVEDAHLPHAGTIVAASYLTVGLSVLVHGLSAAPLVGRYAAWYHKSPPVMEGQPAHEHRARGAALLGR